MTTEPETMLPMPRSLADVLDAGLDPRVEALRPASWRLLGDCIREVLVGGVDPEANNLAYFWLTPVQVQAMKPNDPPGEQRMLEMAQLGLWEWEIKTGRVPLDRLVPFVSEEGAPILTDPDARALAVFRSEVRHLASEANEILEKVQLLSRDLAKLNLVGGLSDHDPLDRLTEDGTDA